MLDIKNNCEHVIKNRPFNWVSSLKLQKILTRKLTFTRLEAAGKVPKLSENLWDLYSFYFTLYRSSSNNSCPKRRSSISNSPFFYWHVISLTVKVMVFPVVIYEYETWTIEKTENWRIDAFELVLEKTLESPLDCRQIKPVSSKENQSWIFTGRTDAEAETPIHWPPDAKNWLIRKDPDAGKDWRQEKGMTKDEMVGWHHQLDGHEFEQALGIGDGQRGLVCCSPWGRKESDTTETLNWTDSYRYEIVSHCCFDLHSSNN